MPPQWAWLVILAVIFSGPAIASALWERRSANRTGQPRKPFLLVIAAELPLLGLVLGGLLTSGLGHVEYGLPCGGLAGVLLQHLVRRIHARPSPIQTRELEKPSV